MCLHLFMEEYAHVQNVCVCLHMGAGVCFLVRVHHACLSVRLHVRVCECVASAKPLTLVLPGNRMPAHPCARPSTLPKHW